MKRSKTLWVLIVFFAWAALKSAGNLYGADVIADHAILASAGLGALYYAFGVPIMIGEAATAWLLFRGHAAAVRTGIAVAVAEVASSAFVMLLTLRDLDAAKAFYIADREARGLSARPEQMDTIFTTQGMLSSMLLYIAFYALVVYLLRRAQRQAQDPAQVVA